MFTPQQTRVIGRGMLETVDFINSYEEPTAEDLRDAIFARIRTAQQKNGVIRGECMLPIDKVTAFIKMYGQLKQAFDSLQESSGDDNAINIYEEEVNDLTALLQERDERIQDLEQQLDHAQANWFKPQAKAGTWLTVKAYAKKYTDSGSPQTVYTWKNQGRVVFEQAASGRSIRILDQPPTANPGKFKKPRK